MDKKVYFDYLIIGCGVAGLHLAYEISKKTSLLKKTIAILDSKTPSKKNHILSFWEPNKGHWDSIVFKKWNNTKFKNQKDSLKINLNSFKYKSLKFQDFYSFCEKRLSIQDNITFIEEWVEDLEEEEGRVVIKGNSKEYTATYVFDSRLSSNFIQNKHKYPLVTQSFRGWEIKVNTPVFDASSFTMMDYRYQFKDSTSFMYILPISKTKALIEYTFFAPFLISKSEFEKQLKGYMSAFFPGVFYEVINKEAGEIPMSSFDFNKESTKRIKKIGTAGGWVKASTGYSFKFAEKNAKIIANQLEKELVPIGYKSPKRFVFYDRLFIKLLQYQNKQGPVVFLEMYKKVPITVLLRFLDEETTFIEELKLILKLPYIPFIKALFTKKHP